MSVLEYCSRLPAEKSPCQQIAGFVRASSTPAGVVLGVLRCSAVHTNLKLLDRVVSGARFLTGSVFECDIAHRQSQW